MLLVKDIVQDDNPSLRLKTETMTLPLSKEDTKTIELMLEYVRNSQVDELIEKYNLRPSVGIAGPQVGVQKKMFVARVDQEEGEPFEIALINPKVLSKSKEMIYLSSGEACLSVTDPYDCLTPRHIWIEVEGYDHIRASNVRFKVAGFEAIVVQHELDHLEGVMFYDNTKTKEELEAMGAIAL